MTNLPRWKLDGFQAPAVVAYIDGTSQGQTFYYEYNWITHHEIETSQEWQHDDCMHFEFEGRDS